MSKKTPDPEPGQQPGQQSSQQPEASGSRWEPDPSAPTEQLAAPAQPAGPQPAASAQPAGPQPTGANAQPTPDAQSAAEAHVPPTAATDVPPPPYPTPVNAAPSSATFASLKALSTGAKGALAGAAAVLVLGSGVTGFAIGQAGDDHQRVDVRFGHSDLDGDGDGRGGFPGGMPGQGQLPQGGTGQFQGQLPQGGVQQDGGTTQNDSSES